MVFSLTASKVWPGSTGLRDYLTNNTATKTNATMQVFANGTSGLDTNDGLTSATPKKTLQAVFDLIPFYVDNNCTINLRGTFSGTTDATAICEKFVSKQNYLVIDGGSEMTVFNNNGGANFTPDTFSFSSIGIAAANWAVDGYMGYLLEIVSGTCMGQTRLIQGNTINTITPIRSFNTTPDATCIFRIVRPTTTIASPAWPAFRNLGYGTMQLQRVYVSGSLSAIEIATSPGLVNLSHIVNNSTCGAGYAYFIHESYFGFNKSLIDPTLYTILSSLTGSVAGISFIGAQFSSAGVFGMYIRCCTYGTITCSVLKALVVFKTLNFNVSSGTRVTTLLMAGTPLNSVSPPGIATTSGYPTTKFGGNNTYPALTIIDSTLGIGEKVEIAGSLHGIDLSNSRLHVEGCMGVTNMFTGAVNTGFGVLARHGSKITIRPAVRNGLGDSFSKTGTTVTFTDAGGNFATSDVGRNITINHATTHGNDGYFVITARPGTTSVTYENASGATEAFTGEWYIGYPILQGSLGDLSVNASTEAAKWSTLGVVGTKYVDTVAELVTASKWYPTGW